MTAWLLVLVFAGDPGPQGHVFARYSDKARCERHADTFNRQGGKVAVCVAWFSNHKGGHSQ